MYRSTSGLFLYLRLKIREIGRISMEVWISLIVHGGKSTCADPDAPIGDVLKTQESRRKESLRDVSEAEAEAMGRVRRRVVEVAGEQASMRTIVPTAASASDSFSGVINPEMVPINT